MSEVAIVIDGVELREVGGEGSTVLETAERLTVYGGASSPRLVVGKTTVPLGRGEKSFTRLGDREYRFPTDDVMAFLFLELPKGLPEVQYAAVASVLQALSEGRPVPTAAVAAEGGGAIVVAPPAPAAAPVSSAAASSVGTAAAVAPAGAAPSAPVAGAGIGAMFGALAAKAMHDTKAVGEAIRAKAEHDVKLYQDEQAANKKGGAPA
jgi:hypothetical protein